MSTSTGSTPDVSSVAVDKRNLAWFVDRLVQIVMFIGGFALLLLSMHAVGGWGQLREDVQNRPPELPLTSTACRR